LSWKINGKRKGNGEERRGEERRGEERRGEERRKIATNPARDFSRDQRETAVSKLIPSIIGRRLIPLPIDARK
jgi:hypothetical protein